MPSRRCNVSARERLVSLRCGASAATRIGSPTARIALDPARSNAAPHNSPCLPNSATRFEPNSSRTRTRKRTTPNNSTPPLSPTMTNPSSHPAPLGGPPRRSDRSVLPRRLPTEDVAACANPFRQIISQESIRAKAAASDRHGMARSRRPPKTDAIQPSVQFGLGPAQN